MKVAEKAKPVLVAEEEFFTREFRLDGTIDVGSRGGVVGEGEFALKAELDLWDEEGRVIAEQIITRFPRLFPYFFDNL